LFCDGYQHIAESWETRRKTSWKNQEKLNPRQLTASVKEKRTLIKAAFRYLTTKDRKRQTPEHILQPCHLNIELRKQIWPTDISLHAKQQPTRAGGQVICLTNRIAL